MTTKESKEIFLATDCIYIKKQGLFFRYGQLDIIMIEAESNYSIIHTINGERLHTAKTLKVWQRKLGHLKVFIRPHRSYLINTLHIEFFTLKSRTITLKGKIEVPIARRFRMNLKQ